MTKQSNPAASVWARRLPRLAAWAAGAALGWSLAGWTWVFVLPVRPAGGAPVPPAPAGAGARLFPDSGPAPLDNYRLLGTWAGDGGFAMIAVAGQPARAWRVGEEVAPNVRLTAVEPDGVRLLAGGRSARLALPDAAPGVQPAGRAAVPRANPYFVPAAPAPGRLAAGGRAHRTGPTRTEP